MSLGLHLTLLIGPNVPLPAPASLMNALQSVEVTNTDDGRDGFQITFTAGRSGPGVVPDYPILSGPLLRPFNRVTIMVAFGVLPKVLINGIITHQQLNPSNEPAKSTLTVTGEDVSVMMDMKDNPATHPNQPDFAVVNKIILSYAQYGLIPMVTTPPSVEVPLMVDRVPFQSGTDLNYVQALAGLVGHVFYVEPTDAPGVSKAYWGPLNLLGVPQGALSVNMGPETNVTSVSFQYNSLSPTLVSGSVEDRNLDKRIPVRTLASLRPPLSSQPALLANQPNVRVRQFTGSGLNSLEAVARAQAETDKSSHAVTVNGELDSLVYGDVLRARKLVGLRGVGYSYDGIYYVKSVTHHIKIGRYTQSFTLTREGLGSLTPAVPPK